jgi:hypothetical protein
MVINVTFNSILVISWWSVLLSEENGEITDWLYIMVSDEIAISISVKRFIIYP